MEERKEQLKEGTRSTMGALIFFNKLLCAGHGLPCLNLQPYEPKEDLT